MNLSLVKAVVTQLEGKLSQLVPVDSTLNDLKSIHVEQK